MFSFLLFIIINIDFWRLFFVIEFILFFIISIHGNFRIYLINLSISTFIISFIILHLYCINYIFLFFHKLFFLIIYNWKILFKYINSYNFIFFYEIPYIFFIYSLNYISFSSWYLNIFYIVLIFKIFNFLHLKSDLIIIFTINHSIIFIYLFLSLNNISFYLMFFYIFPYYIYCLFFCYFKSDCPYFNLNIWSLICSISYGGLVFQEYIALIFISIVCFKCTIYIIFTLYIIVSRLSSIEFFNNIYIFSYFNLLLYIIILYSSIFTFIFIFFYILKNIILFFVSNFI